MTQIEYLAKVLNMVEDSISKPKVNLFQCDICEQEFPDKELSEIELTNGEDKLVCRHCEINLPEPDDDIDEDQFRGDR